MNKDEKFNRILYRIIGFIDVEYNGDVKTAIVAEDLTDTPEEFYVQELYDVADSEFQTIDMEWKWTWQ